MPGYVTRRPANKERVCISRRGMDGLLLQPLVYQTLLKERCLASHVQWHVLSTQTHASSVSARERFFLTAPELRRLTEEAHMMAGTPTATRKEHHDLSQTV